MCTTITRDNFVIKNTYLHGMVHICLLNICSPHLPVNCLSPLGNPRAYSLLLSSRCYISLNCLTLPGSFTLFMGLAYVQYYICFSPVNPVYANLITRQAKESWRRKLRPPLHWQTWVYALKTFNWLNETHHTIKDNLSFYLEAINYRC